MIEKIILKILLKNHRKNQNFHQMDFFEKFSKNSHFYSHLTYLGVLLSLCVLSGCTTCKEMTAEIRNDLKQQYYQINDKNDLEAVSWDLECGNLDKARARAKKLCLPESRAGALIRIAYQEINKAEKCVPQTATLDQIADAIKDIDTPAKKLALQKAFADLLGRIVSKSDHEKITVRLNSILDDLLETIRILDRSEQRLSDELYVAILRYKIDSKQAREELKNIEEKIWQISSALHRAPFLIDLVSFELVVTKDAEAATKAIEVAKDTIEKIAFKELREIQEKNLARIIDRNSNVLCR